MDYTDAFLSAVDHLMLYEVSGSVNINDSGFIDGSNLKACGYVNDPSDPGGATKYGIALNENPDVDVANLDWEGAKAIYYNRYWLKGSCDKLPGRVGALEFDGCVNNGIGGASRFLQRAVGATPDGSIGPGTLNAVSNKDPIVICNTICDLRLQYYRDIIVANPTQGKYQSGWFRRVQEMRTFVTDPNGDF